MSTDPRFSRSNEMLNAQLLRLKKLGKENSQHKPTLEDEDLEKLKSSDALSLSDPLSLLRNVWFHIVFYFCRRGREGQRELQRSSFILEVDTSGRNYVTMAHDEVSKNHPCCLKDTSSTEKYARMYETDSPNDGYKAVKVYLSKLNPKSSAFFQYPSRNWAPSDPVWYDNKPLGINKLDSMMKEISQAAQLSRVYTNHRSVPQQSPSGRMLESLTAISWRFLAIGMSRAWLTTTHVLQPLSFCTAAKSFPAVFKGPRR